VRIQSKFILESNNFLEDENIWYTDTDCNNHMCENMELFSFLDESIKSIVKFYNNTNILILDKDKISI